MALRIGQTIFSFAPASVANVGPCYDIMGYCLNYPGDFVEVKITGDTEKLLWKGVKGPQSDLLKDIDKEKNAAYGVAFALWNSFYDKDKHPFGIELTLHKYMPIASGLGSSAASGVAAAKLITHILSSSLPDKEMCKYLMIGEAITSGASHPDNVVPSYFGGFLLMFENNFKRIELTENLISIIVKPDTQISTYDAREKVRSYIYDSYRSYAVGCSKQQNGLLK